MHIGIKIGIGAAATVLLAAALYIFYTYDPEIQPIFPKCPFLFITGFECPGCGSQRAIHSLLHFDFGAALKYNAFMVFALPYVFLGIYTEYLGGKKRFPRVEKFFFGRRSAVVVLVVIITFWVLRNAVRILFL